jgi:GNAT superfamily N-acetyltransferase
VSVIRPCTEDDLAAAWTIINAAATAYAGVIPDDRYHEPYMSKKELRSEIDDGVRFWGWFEEERAGAGSVGDETLARPSSLPPARLVGVMGIQDVGDVTLIRHAYVEPSRQGRGIGGELLDHLVSLPHAPLLVGTWEAATRAIGFYERHGFRLVSSQEKNELLRRYWHVPERQIETSVVLRLDEEPGPAARPTGSARTTDSTQGGSP